MKIYISAVVLSATVLASTATALAQTIYSFETIEGPGPNGFFGLGATVTQDTIGATLGQHSMKYEVGTGGFVGARTEIVDPNTLNDPPGVDHILFDLTIVNAYNGTFADIGITVFGHALNHPNGAEFGHQVQFADQVSIASLGVGTHLDRQIDLDLSLGPYRPGESFNDIFGPGPFDLTVPSAFQFYISKNVLDPVTIYIDNVRVSVPEPASFGALALGMALLALKSRTRK